MARSEGINWEFWCGYGPTRTKIEAQVYVYDSVLEIVAAFFGYTPRFILENTNVVHPDTKMTAQAHIDDCNEAGTWGWCVLAGKNRAMHVWYDSGRGHEEVLPNLLATLAHEQGHLFGVYESDPAREEQRAVGYELIAASSLELARKILRRNCGTQRSIISLREDILNTAKALHKTHDHDQLVSMCETLQNTLHELRGTLGA